MINMNDQRHLTWENYEATLLEPGLRARHRINGDPPLDLFVTDGATEAGLLIPVNAGASLPAFRVKELALAAIIEDGTRYFRLAASNSVIFQPFYFFSLIVADLIQLDGLSAGNAILEAAKRWEAIRRGDPPVSLEEQLGLIGELWVLQRRLSSCGTGSIDSWVGPIGENHDFRYGDYDLEVKTTTQQDRVHTINGLMQLQSTPPHQLFIVSLHLQPAGLQNGWSLNSLVAECRGHLKADGARLSRFDQILRGNRYVDRDCHYYESTYNHRAVPTIVPAEQCPCFNVDSVTRWLGNTCSRLVDISYRIDVGGLGFPEGSRDFARILA